MATKLIEQPFIIIEVKQQNSLSERSIIYRINLIGLLDRKTYHTFINPKFGNFKQWKAYIDRPHEGFLIEGLLLKKGNLIDADSRPKLYERFQTLEDARKTVRKLWAKIDEEGIQL